MRILGNFNFVFFINLWVTSLVVTVSPYSLAVGPVKSSERHLLFLEGKNTVEMTLSKSVNRPTRIRVAWPNGAIEKKALVKDKYQFLSYNFKTTKGWASAEFYWSARRKAYLPIRIQVLPYDTLYYSSPTHCQKTNFTTQFKDIFRGLEKEEIAPLIEESKMIDGSCRSPSISAEAEKRIVDNLGLIFGSHVDQTHFIGCLESKNQSEFASALKGQIYLLTQSEEPVINCKKQLEDPIANVEFPKCKISLSGFENGNAASTDPDVIAHEIVHCTMQPTPLPVEDQEKYTSEVIACCGMRTDKSACDRISLLEKTKFETALSDLRDLNLGQVATALSEDKIYPDSYKLIIGNEWQSRIESSAVKALSQEKPECSQNESFFNSNECRPAIQRAMQKAVNENINFLCDSIQNANSISKVNCTKDAFGQEGLSSGGISRLWKKAQYVSEKLDVNRARQVPLTEAQREAMTVEAQAGVAPELPRIAEPSERIALETNTNGTLNTAAYAPMREIAQGAAREADSMWDRVYRTVLPEAQAAPSLAQADSGSGRAPASIGSPERETRSGRGDAKREIASLPSGNQAPTRVIAFRRLGYDLKPIEPSQLNQPAEIATRKIDPPKAETVATGPRKADNFSRVDSILNPEPAAKARDSKPAESGPNPRAVASVTQPQGSPSGATAPTPSSGTGQATRLIGSGAKPNIAEPKFARTAQSVNGAGDTTSRFSKPIVQGILSRGSRYGATELKGILITDPNFSAVLADMNYQIVDWDSTKGGKAKKPKVYGTERNPVAMFEIRDGKLLNKSTDPDGNGT